MASTFGWLDTDSDQRRKMLEVVDLFKEQGTVDELGIGSIRDALAGALFPGISYVHTRLRYVLFIPWLLQRATSGGSPTGMSTEFRKLEYRLITSLLAGGEHTGVIGNRARDNLRRLPSGIYWGALGEWGIRTSEFSAEGYFRRQHDYRALASRSLRADDPEARELMPSTGLDPHLPEPPADLLKAVTFQLRAEDEQYLSDRIAATTPGSMLSWLIYNQPSELPDYFWELDNLGEAPQQLRDLCDHARRFHTAIYGALLVYNLLLARKSGRDELVADLEDETDVWRDELATSGVLEDWGRRDWWATVRQQNPRISVPTQRFVDAWLNLIRVDSAVATIDRAAELVTRRELQIKGGRARLVNRAALDRWTGASGLGRLDYRWSIAKPDLADLYEARRAA